MSRKNKQTSAAYLNHAFELIHAQAQIGHAGLVHVTHGVVVHDGHQHGERFFFGHLDRQAWTSDRSRASFTNVHEKKADDEGNALTVANFAVVHGVGLEVRQRK